MNHKKQLDVKYCQLKTHILFISVLLEHHPLYFNKYPLKQITLTSFIYICLMLNFPTLFRQNQIKQSYSCSLTYQNSFLLTYLTYANSQHFVTFKTLISTFCYCVNSSIYFLPLWTKPPPKFIRQSYVSFFTFFLR